MRSPALTCAGTATSASDGEEPLLLPLPLPLLPAARSSRPPFPPRLARRQLSRPPPSGSSNARPTSAAASTAPPPPPWPPRRQQRGRPRRAPAGAREHDDAGAVGQEGRGGAEHRERQRELLKCLVRHQHDPFTSSSSAQLSRGTAAWRAPRPASPRAQSPPGATAPRSCRRSRGPSAWLARLPAASRTPGCRGIS